MRTKISIKIIILLPIVGILLAGLFLFGLFILYKVIQEPDFIGFIVGFMFLWMSTGLGILLFDEFRSFEIKNKTLIIRRILSGKKTTIELSNVRFTEYDWGEINWIIMNGILIQYEVV